MQDPRALANPKTLESYRAWEQEGVRRSGFSAILSGVMALTPVLTGVILLARPTTKVAHTWVLLVGTAFALYVATALSLMLFAVLRLNAWKRAHPWAPPSRRGWK
jgi:hypothetical protein